MKKNKFMQSRIRKSMQLVASLPKLKARNNYYLKLKQLEEKYKQ